MYKPILALGLASLLVTPALAQGYPEKPVRVIVPYNAGGAVDYLGRVLAQQLSEELGQQFVVENRAGASGNIGAQAVASSEADGYTLLMTSVTSSAITSALQPDTAGYNLDEDLEGVGMVGLVPFLLVSSAQTPAANFDEFLAYALEQGDALAYGSSGVGSAEHLGAELLAGIAGFEALHVPYTGAAPAMTDVVADRLPMMVATVPTALPHIDAGAVTPLVVALDSRIDSLPDVPSAPEAGIEGFDVVSLYGLLAPVGLSEDVKAALSEALSAVVEDSEFTTALEERGILPVEGGVESAQDMFLADVEKWYTRVKNTDLTAE
ncbi:Bug family tripartite tricarboxylate transporter substrate binding protein [Pelagibacterium halotolerans]|uniref:Putative exported protein n=1 Tax=Pelagibacterium halotolerans (strain DSM 22347 / JCM 15775 / CGMCC 1.7692 / B2) TaxID=1082931 RepID=G4R743_PELHB|nr:tripartite tricarboxylate transporter substrate-binding protein [Pelagibacterium halotolerans]AEQ50197.1 putative exported protein [Pelagibacterium halotolerans B2]QJR19799.1 tripartite tricarboxylate transporter substrate binding protein [Pelagibacterium halotolerans]SEA50413.1 Tripartite-type tricarboxylate transporter, receptor component TctC [Pelagibacterium halotolerans]